jgi:hypothetical protein
MFIGIEFLPAEGQIQAVGKALVTRERPALFSIGSEYTGIE